MTTTFKVEGLRELGESMRALSAEVATRIARSMTNGAAQVVKKAAVQHIVSSPSVETGSLSESVIVKRIPARQTTHTSEHIVTVRGRGKIIKRGKRKGQRQTEAPHAHFVEFGTVNMPPEPFLRPALDKNKEAAAEAMREIGRRRIEAAARKANKGRP